PGRDRPRGPHRPPGGRPQPVVRDGGRGARPCRPGRRPVRAGQHPRGGAAGSAGGAAGRPRPRRYQRGPGLRGRAGQGGAAHGGGGRGEGGRHPGHARRGAGRRARARSPRGPLLRLSRRGPGGEEVAMFLSNLSIKQPVFATLMMAALAVLGLTSYRQLKVDMFPNVEFPIVTVTTVYPGASPETVEREVTKKIEESINTVQGIKHVESTSQEGLSSILIAFRLEVSTHAAAQAIRARVAGIRGARPREIDEPVVQRIDPGALPIVSVAVSAPGLAPRAATGLADKVVKRRLENVPGV